MNRAILLSIVSCIAVDFSSHGQNLLANGSFESPVIANNSLQHVTPTSWSWGVSQGWIFNGQPSVVWPLPQDGQQFADIGNESFSALTQTYNAPSEGSYVLSWYDCTGTNDLTTSPYSTLIFAGAVQIVSNRFEAYHAAPQTWVQRSIQFTLPPRSSSVRFQSEGVFNGLDSLIDNVALVQFSGNNPPPAGAVLYFDNFEQFGSGTDLTTNSYTPLSGPATALAETSVQTGTPKIYATNIFGSEWALFSNSVPPLNKNQYKGTLSSVQNNRALQISWKMWIQSTNSGPGFFFFSVPVNDVNPDVTYNPPLAFADNGTIFAITNGTSPLTPIGNWSSLAGTVMVNTLLLDYPNHSFSYSLNGQVLATLPLGPYFSDAVDAIYFNGFERSSGSLGNLFAIDDVSVVLRPLTLGIMWSNSLPTVMVSGDVGSSFVLEYASALAPVGNWQGLVTNTITSSPFIRVDTNAIGDATRFYRARLLP